MLLVDPRLGYRSFVPGRAPRRAAAPSPPSHTGPCGASGTVSLVPYHPQHQPLSRPRASPTETATTVLVGTSTDTRTACESTVPGGDGDGDEEPQAGPGPRSSLAAPEVCFVSLVDGKYTVRGLLLLPVPPARVYAVLTDYEDCQRVFSNIAASEVLRPASGASDGGSDDGEQRRGLQVLQSCRWKFLAFSGTFRVHLGVSEDPGSGTLLFSLLQSNFMRDFEGRWTVRSAAAKDAAAAAAGSDSEWCEVEHQLSVVPSVPVPPPVSYYTRNIFVRQVEGILSDLQRAVLAEAEGGRKAAPRGVEEAALVED